MNDEWFSKFKNRHSFSILIYGEIISSDVALVSPFVHDDIEVLPGVSNFTAFNGVNYLINCFNPSENHYYY